MTPLGQHPDRKFPAATGPRALCRSSVGQASACTLICGPSGSRLQACSQGGSHQAVDIGAFGVSGWSWVRLCIALEFVNPVPKEYLAFAGAIKHLWAKARGHAMGLGKSKVSPCSPGEAGQDQTRSHRYLLRLPFRCEAAQHTNWQGWVPQTK